MKLEDIKIGGIYRPIEPKCGVFNKIYAAVYIKITGMNGETFSYDILDKDKNKIRVCYGCFKPEDLEETLTWNGEIINIPRHRISYAATFIDTIGYPTNGIVYADQNDSLVGSVETPINLINEPTMVQKVKNTMSSLVKKLKDLKLSAEDRILREEGLEDENGNLTYATLEMMQTELIEERWEARKSQIAKDLLKLKEEK